jgi:hypothetical protein
MTAGIDITDNFDLLDKTVWQEVSGRWTVEEGRLKGESGYGDGLIFIKDRIYSDFVMEADISVYNREGSFAFRALDTNNMYLLVFNPKTNKESQGSILLIRRVNGKESYFAGAEQYVYIKEKINLKVETEGANIEIYVNGKLRISVEDTNFTSGKAGFRVYGDFLNSCKAYFDNFSIKPKTK